MPNDDDAKFEDALKKLEKIGGRFTPARMDARRTNWRNQGDYKLGRKTLLDTAERQVRIADALALKE